MWTGEPCCLFPEIATMDLKLTNVWMLLGVGNKYPNMASCAQVAPVN